MVDLILYGPAAVGLADDCTYCIVPFSRYINIQNPRHYLVSNINNTWRICAIIW